jgi:DNA repair exonuclease SbcCD ATPase subunit
LFAVAAIGIVLAILGINNNKTYKAKLQKYEESKANAARNAENLQKKKELERQLQDVQNSISGLNKQIFDNENSIVSDNVAVSNWASKWIPGIEASESAISNIIDEARQYKSIIGNNNKIDEKKKFVEATKIEIEKSLRSVEDEYPEILGMSNDEVLKSLRTLENEYKTKKEQLEKAIAKKEKFLSELGLDEEAMSSDNAPKSDADKEALTTKEHLEKLINSDNEILERINLNIDAENFTEVLGKAEKWLIEFKQYNEKQQERGSRQNRKKQQISELQTKMDEKAVVLCKQYSDIELPDRLAKVREDITAARQLKKKLEERKSDKEKKDREFGIAKDLVDDFTERFDVDAKDQTVAIEIIAGNSVSYRDLLKQMNHLLEQKKPIEEELKKAVGGSVGSSEEEKLLRLDIKGLEEKRDGFRDEYQQKNDFIRQADASLERYPDIVAEIRKLYDEKQKAQSNLDTLKRTKALITKAKENLANRYLSKVEDMFNNYMHIWLNNDAVRGVLDIDFNVAIEEDGVEHLAQGYSTGYCDLIDFCMRLALVDTLFENEQPFLILDDPFVNLDTDRLDKALDLLDAMAASKQIVYFVCHPIRAVKTDGDSDARKKFAELAEATKKSMEERKTTVIAKKPVVKKLPRELYVVKNSKFKPAIQPAKPDYVITNSIFSMKLVADEMFTGDASYELFFIDAIGHVMNERQLVEVKAGKLSTDRVQFSLNTRDDSGDQYELMIRESGADDYEVLQRFPFKVKLAFAGTFSFDF